MGYGGDAKSLPHFSPSLFISSQVCILRRPPDSGLITVRAVPVYKNYYSILSINGFQL